MTRRGSTAPSSATSVGTCRGTGSWSSCHPRAAARISCCTRPAASARQGQAQAKLAFRVADVAAFVADAAAQGVVFGTIHDGGGYAFANAKDPAGNSVQVTSRP